MPGLQDLLGLGDIYSNMTRAFGRPRLPVGLADADDEGWEEDIGGRPVAPRMPAVRGLQKTLLEQMMGREGYMGSPEQYSMLNPEMDPAEASRQALQRRMDVEDWAVAKPLQRGYVDPTHERELAGLRRVSPVPAWERDRDATWNLTGSALRDRALQKGLVMPQGGGVPQTDESKDLVAAARASQVAQQTAAQERAMRNRSMASAFRAGGLPLLALQMQGWGGGGGEDGAGGTSGMNPQMLMAMGVPPEEAYRITAASRSDAARLASAENIARGVQTGDTTRQKDLISANQGLQRDKLQAELDNLGIQLKNALKVEGVRGEGELARTKAATLPLTKREERETEESTWARSPAGIRSDVARRNPLFTSAQLDAAVKTAQGGAGATWNYTPVDPLMKADRLPFMDAAAQVLLQKPQSPPDILDAFGKQGWGRRDLADQILSLNPQRKGFLGKLFISPTQAGYPETQNSWYNQFPTPWGREPPEETRKRMAILELLRQAGLE